MKRALGVSLALLGLLGGCKRHELAEPELVEGPTSGGPQPELVVQAGSNHYVSDVEFSPDGRYLAMSSVDGLLKIVDMRMNKEWRTLSGASGPLYSVSWSPDGSRLAAGGFDRIVHVWDVASGKEIVTLPGHSGWVGTVEFSPDGKSIASAARLLDPVVAVWDVEAKELKHALTHAKGASELTWSRDSKTLLTGGEEVVVWDAEGGGRLGEIAIDTVSGGRQPLQVSPDGALLAIGGSDKTVHLFDTSSWGETAKLGGAGLIGWDRDGSLVVHTGSEVARVDPRSGDRRGGFAADEAMRGLELGGRLAAVMDDMEVQFVDASNGAKLWRIESEFWRQVGGPFGNDTPLLQVAWSPTAPVIATGGFDGVLRVLDLRRGVAPRAVEAGPRMELVPGAKGILPDMPPVKVGLISDVEFTGDGAYVLTRDLEGVSQWDVRSLVRVRQFFATDATAQSLAPDGKSIAIAHGDAVISVFDTTTGEKLRSSKGGGLDADCQRGRTTTLSVGARIGGLGWSLDGKSIYALYRDSATLAGFDAQTFALGKGGCAHNNRINAVGWSDARDMVAIGAGMHMISQSISELSIGDNSVMVFSLVGEMPRLHRFRGHELAVLGVDFSPDGKLLATAGADRTARLWDLKGGAEVATIRGHAAEVGTTAFSHDNKFLATASYDLTMKVWDVASDPKDPKLVATMVTLGPDGYVIETPDHHYTASRTGFESVSFRLGGTVVPVELFDLRLNRPDIVLKRFGYAPAELLGLYEKAHRKRLKKMGLTEDALRPDFHVPTVQLTGDVPPSTGERSLSLSLVAEDTRYKLDRLQVYVNDVPIHGSAGIDLRGQKTRREQRTLDVALLPGRNKIQVAALNSAGTESLKQTVEVVSTATARPGKLYVVAVGVSRYADVRMNLKYAAKDAQDIAAAFRERGKRFSGVEVVQILDGEAVRETILAARAKLEATTIDDQVVVFVAGHGMLDEHLDYYFVTHDFDREKPPKRGLSYEQLESLLDGIPARRKLMMMDTCHSGEVDDEAMRAPPPPPGASGVKMASDFRTFSYGGAVQSPDRSGELLGQLFADLRRGSGAAVISSASGAEYALESARWHNGVFTFSVLQGLTGPADRNGDGTIRVSELRDYVVDEVHRLTRGAQTPTSRRENLEFDFPVF